MKLYCVYYGDRYEGGGIIGIYLNENNAIKNAMRRVYQKLRHTAQKVPNKWEWFDDYDFVAVKERVPDDAKDLHGDSLIPTFMRYKEFLEEIPLKELEFMRMQARNRRKLREVMDKIKRRK